MIRGVLAVVALCAALSVLWLLGAMAAGAGSVGIVVVIGLTVPAGLLLAYVAAVILSWVITR